ncbi:unnamed protein product [Brassica oleracea]
MSFAISISVRFKIRRWQNQDRVNFFNSIAIKKKISFLNFRFII